MHATVLILFLNSQHSSDTIKGNIDLAAEWESFEKLIAGDDDQEKEKYFVPEPIGVPAPVAAPSIILKQDELYCVENGQKEKSELESEISKASTSDEHKRKRSLPTDSSESGSELESDDSSDDSEESSEESSASDEPDRKKPRHNSKSSKYHYLFLCYLCNNICLKSTLLLVNA